MPTAQQKQSEFVERAMELSFEYAKAISRADFFSGRVLNSRFLTPAYDAKDALFTHLESHAQQQDAVVGALVGALEDLDNYVCNNIVNDYPTGIDVNDKPFKAARELVAAYHAMKEQP